MTSHRVDATGREVVIEMPSVQGMVQIADQTLNSTAASIDFQNIPQTYNHLKLLCFLKGSANDWHGIRFNNDTAANYGSVWMSGVNSSAGAGTTPGAAYGYVGLHGSAGTIAASTEIMIPNYKDGATLRRSWLAYNVDLAYVGAIIAGGSWNSTAAINRITLIPIAGGTFSAGSRVTLHGIT